GMVLKDSPADKAGLKEGDKILEVDGHPVQLFHGMKDSVVWHIVSSEGDKIPFKVERDGQVLTIESGFTKPVSKWWQRGALRQVGSDVAIIARVAEVNPEGPAARAGLKPGDEITHINGERIFRPFVLSDINRKAPDQPIALTIDRNGEALDFTVTPEKVVW